MGTASVQHSARAQEPAPPAGRPAARRRLSTGSVPAGLWIEQARRVTTDYYLGLMPSIPFDPDLLRRVVAPHLGGSVEDPDPVAALTTRMLDPELSQMTFASHLPGMAGAGARVIDTT